MNNHIVVANDATFPKEVLESPIPVLVDFWAPWCGPCRIISPIVEEIAEEFADKIKVVKLNTDENSETSIAYGIMSIPTLAIFRNGEVVDGVIGVIPKKGLKDLLERQLNLVPVS
jgi:thioredoxin 1